MSAEHVELNKKRVVEIIILLLEYANFPQLVDRLGDLPYPGFETQSPLRKPQLALKTVVSPFTSLLVLNVKCPGI